MHTPTHDLQAENALSVNRTRFVVVARQTVTDPIARAQRLALAFAPFEKCDATSDNQPEPPERSP